jgi:hypothetical protein
MLSAIFGREGYPTFYAGTMVSGPKSYIMMGKISEVVILQESILWFLFVIISVD